MIQFSAVTNTNYQNTRTGRRHISLAVSNLPVMNKKDSLLAHINQIQKDVSALKESMKLEKKKKKSVLPNPLALKILFDLIRDSQKKENRKKRRRDMSLTPINRKSNFKLVNIPNYFGKLHKPSQDYERTPSDIIEENLDCLSDSEITRSNDLNSPYNDSKILDRRQVSIMDKKRKKESLTSEFFRVMTENTIYAQSGSKSFGTMNKLKSNKDMFNQEKRVIPVRNRKILKKIITVVHAVMFCNYLMTKYSEIKAKRKDIAYSFYDKCYEEVQTSMTEFVNMNIKDPITQFIENRKIIDFTSSHISTTKMHSLIRDYSVG